MPSADAPLTTLLYVPADRPDRIEKALASSADIVAVDLEDAVAPERKVKARKNVLDLLRGDSRGRHIQVRINPRGSTGMSPILTALPISARTLRSDCPRPAP